jgi:glycosyltransferase involved in cell wall biosynthesis
MQDHESSGIRLTVVIPTYNRNESLLLVVRALLPQLTPTCQILILDNGSDTPVAQTLQKELLANPLSIRVVRLPYNVGPAMDRCLELCETPWMWGLNDKAVLRRDAIQIVIETIRTHQDCIFINFTPYIQELNGRGPKRSVAVDVEGRYGLIKNMIDYGSTIDYIANVFHVPSYNNSLGYAYFHRGSGASQFAAVLHAIGNGKKAHYSNLVPVERPPTPPHLRWSQLTYMPMYLSPLSLLSTEAERALLRTRILDFMPTRKYFIVKFILMALSEKDQAKYYFRVYKYLMLEHNDSIPTRFYIYIGTALLMAPKLSALLLSYIAKSFFGRNLSDVT